MIYREYTTSPIGDLEVTANAKGVLSVYFVDKKTEPEQPNEWTKKCVECVQKYFQNEESNFHTLMLGFESTEFQESVWVAAAKIPAGSTATYQDIAKLVGKPHASRAVGNALNRNKHLLLVPCHRIVPSNFAKTADCGGFAGGVWRKEWLLEHEKAV